MTVGERIKSRRKELGMTQTELANKIGAKDKSSISKIESRGDDVSIRDIVRISTALNTTPQHLLGYDFNVVAEKDVPLELRFSDSDMRLLAYTDAYKVMNDQNEIARLYKQASPEIQKAVKILLKSEQQET